MPRYMRMKIGIAAGIGSRYSNRVRYCNALSTEIAIWIALKLRSKQVAGLEV